MDLLLGDDPAQEQREPARAPARRPAEQAPAPRCPRHSGCSVTGRPYAAPGTPSLAARPRWSDPARWWPPARRGEHRGRNGPPLSRRASRAWTVATQGVRASRGMNENRAGPTACTWTTSALARERHRPWRVPCGSPPPGASCRSAGGSAAHATIAGRACRGVAAAGVDRHVVAPRRQPRGERLHRALDPAVRGGDSAQPDHRDPKRSRGSPLCVHSRVLRCRTPSSSG